MLLPRADLQFPGRDDVALSMRPDLPQGSSLLGFRPGPVVPTGEYAPRSFGDVHRYADQDLRLAANATDAGGQPTVDARAAQEVRPIVKKAMYGAAPEIEMRQPLVNDQGEMYLGPPTGEKTSLRNTQADLANEISAIQAQNQLFYGRPTGPRKYVVPREPGDLSGEVQEAILPEDKRRALDVWIRRGNRGVPGTRSTLEFEQLQKDPRLGSLVDLHDARLARAAMNPSNAGVLRENISELSGNFKFPGHALLKTYSLPAAAGTMIGLERAAELPAALGAAGGYAPGLPPMALVPPFLDIEADYQAAIERQRKDRQP
jgi:hypothetical protein